MGWKVPGRQIYTHSFKSWIKEIAWCYFVIKVWPSVIDLHSDSLKAEYINSPNIFADQYRWLICRVNGLKEEVYLESGRS